MRNVLELAWLRLGDGTIGAALEGLCRAELAGTPELIPLTTLEVGLPLLRRVEFLAHKEAKTSHILNYKKAK